jgi:hypothetical protein
VAQYRPLPAAQLGLFAEAGIQCQRRWSGAVVTHRLAVTVPVQASIAVIPSGARPLNHHPGSDFEKGSPMRVFVSCVSREFGAYRDDLSGALTAATREVKVQEQFQAGGGTLLEKLDHYIDGCDAIIHLVGEGVGAVAKPAEVRWLLDTYHDFSQRLPELASDLDPDNCPFSYTQWECFLALYHRVPR